MILCGHWGGLLKYLRRGCSAHALWGPSQNLWETPSRETPIRETPSVGTPLVTGSVHGHMTGSRGGSHDLEVVSAHDLEVVSRMTFRSYNLRKWGIFKAMTSYRTFSKYGSCSDLSRHVQTCPVYLFLEYDESWGIPHENQSEWGDLNIWSNQMSVFF